MIFHYLHLPKNLNRLPWSLLCLSYVLRHSLSDLSRLPGLTRATLYSTSDLYRGYRKADLNLTSSMASPVAWCSALVALRCFVHVPSPHGAVLDIRPRTLNLIPRVLTNGLSDALMLLSQYGSTGDCISTTFITRNILWIHGSCWIGHHMRTLINLYSAYAHWPSLFRRFRCCGCCAAAATASQPVSSAILHAPPVESGHWLIGSRGVAIALPTTLTTKNQPHHSVRCARFM